MLVTKSYPFYEFAYFMGIAGTLQALLTPDLGIYGFPHYRFFQTFIWLEVIGLLNCLVLYVPFVIKDWRMKAQTV